MDYKLLSGIKSPNDVKKLNKTQIDALCEEIRECIIDTVSKNGGHLASNLGIVELTVALHRVFSSPDDAIIFDVGHQSYAHKLLTGRFDNFSTIRKEGGLSGFMRPSESEHDPFVTGHSSNSISAAYGIYKGKAISGKKGSAIAVIGDGAMTGGMAYEALNNAGDENSNFIVVLNDNEMSISKNVGSMARAFTKLRNRPHYHKVKFAITNLLLKIPVVGKGMYNIIFLFKEAIKTIIYRNNIFTSLGFNYLGPVSGHDVEALESLLEIAKSYKRPTLVHVITVKGRGYTYAEDMPNSYHGVSPFDKTSGADASKKKSYSDIVGETLTDIANNNDKVCAITAAMTDGTGLVPFAEKHPKRFFDVGIAEQHAVTFAAGLAKGGMIPYFAVYSSFLQRGYDQIIHDAAIEGLPIKLLIDRAGIVGDDGESHQGVFDAAYLSTIPNMNVYSPCYYSELKKLMIQTSQNRELCAIRYPRGCEKGVCECDFDGDYTVLGEGGKIAIVTYGKIFANALDAQKALKNVSVVKLNKIFPISSKLVDTLSSYEKIFFFEEGIKSGGIAEHIASALLQKEYSGKYSIYAINSEFVAAGTVDSVLKKYHLDTDSMIEIVKG